MKKIVFMLMLLASGTLAAEPVTPQRAATVAANFMYAQRGCKAPVELTLHSSDWQYDGIYLFDCQQGGWVLVAADDCAKPILGYSTSGTFDPANLPPALRLWLAGYEEQLAAIGKAHAAKGAVPVYPADAAEWKRLEGFGPTSLPKGNGVEPLITTHWDQRYPYDQLCPAGTVTGCAATALAMYMKFWNYPAFGCGSYSYNPPRTGTTESADFGHTLYDWAHMPDSASQYDTPEEVEAVATLMYHCGVGMAMDYGTAESGGSAAVGIVDIAGYPSMDNALKQYFHYSPGMTACFKDYGHTNDSWRSLLIAELDEGRPILYSGAAVQGGHAFLCDGYDERQYMHFNFGWSGIGDGYYPVDSISPGVGGVGGNVTYTFNMQNACLIGAVPDYALRVSDTLFNYLAGGGSDSLLVGIDETNNATLDITSGADWITVEHVTIGRAGWVRLHAAPMTEGDERTAFIHFVQGEDTVNVKVVQVNYNADDMCPLTVVMENTNTHYDGWKEGAFLTLESAGGYIFGTARLDSLNLDSVTIRVAPHDVRCVWHSGGGSDRYVNYRVRNQYGEDCVAVVNAHRNGGSDLIAWPCAHVDIEELLVLNSQFTIYPNPASTTVTVELPGPRTSPSAQKPQGPSAKMPLGTPSAQMTLLDATGREIAIFKIQDSKTVIDVTPLPAGVYFLRLTTAAGVSVKRFVKR